ncbi:MAG: cupin domain-containing protein [Pseudomonadota bacterium]
MRTTLILCALAMATPAAAHDSHYIIDLDKADYRKPPVSDLVETATVYGDVKAAGLYATHARAKEGAIIPPHTHPNTLTTWVTSGTVYVGIGEVFDESALVGYPAGTFFVTEAGVPHFIVAKDGEFSVLDHGAGPGGFTLIEQPSE